MVTYAIFGAIIASIFVMSKTSGNVAQPAASSGSVDHSDDFFDDEDDEDF